MSLTTGTSDDVDHSPETDGRHYSNVELFDMGFDTLMTAARLDLWSFWAEMEVDR